MEKILTIDEQNLINNMLTDIKLSSDKIVQERNNIYNQIDEINKILNNQQTLEI
jgi:hypothetical protein